MATGLGNKEKAIAAFWSSPAGATDVLAECKITNPRFGTNKITGRYGNGDVSIRQRPGDDAPMVFFNHGTGRAGAKPIDIFELLTDETGKDFSDVLLLMDEKLNYGYTLNETKEQKAYREKKKLLSEYLPVCFDIMAKSLQNNPNGEVAKYLQSRNLKADGRYFGELTADTLQQIEQRLKLDFPDTTPNSADAIAINTIKGGLNLTKTRIEQTYNLVIGIYENGHLKSVKSRCLNGDTARKVADAYKAKTGKDIAAGKYLALTALPSPAAFCERLGQTDDNEKPVFCCEGEIDAITLYQQGYKNVIAFSGANLRPEALNLILTHGFKTIIYIADADYKEVENADGTKTTKRKTNLIEGVSKYLRENDTAGQLAINYIDILQLPGITDTGKKLDINDVAIKNADLLNPDTFLLSETPLTIWQLEQATADPNAITYKANTFRKAVELYEQTPGDKAAVFLQVVDANPVLKKLGITADTIAHEQTRKTKLKELQTLKAIEQAATKGDTSKVGELNAQLAKLQTSDKADDFNNQLKTAAADILADFRNRPQPKPTKWTLGLNIGGKYKAFQNIGLYAGDISVICAQSSHCKTAFMFSTAYDLAKATGADTRNLYISCEENQKQLFERFTNICLLQPGGVELDGGERLTIHNLTPDEQAAIEGGKPYNGADIIKGYGKAAISAYLNGQRNVCIDYDANGKPHVWLYTEAAFNKLCGLIEQALKKHVFPVWDYKIKFVYSMATADDICRHAEKFVEDTKQNGGEVGAIFIDYFQLLRADETAEARTYELKDICLRLKDFAAKTDTPVVIASQFNREGLKGGGFDGANTANIGESIDIERIARDLFLLWQISKIDIQQYAADTKTKNATCTIDDGTNEGFAADFYKIVRGKRSRFVFKASGDKCELKKNHLYIEQLKARYGQTGVYGLLKTDLERGYIGEVDRENSGADNLPKAKAATDGDSGSRATQAGKPKDNSNIFNALK